MDKFIGSTENIKLGTCYIKFDGKDLGLTAGGVEVDVSTTTYEVKVDQFGETVVKEIVTGRNITASIPLAETTKENLAALMPGSTFVADKTTPTDMTKARTDVAAGVGIDLLKEAKTLILHPIDKAEDDYSEDLIIHKAMAPGSINFAYKIDDVRVYKADFKGYPDKDRNNILFTYGFLERDSSGDIVKTTT